MRETRPIIIKKEDLGYFLINNKYDEIFLIQDNIDDVKLENVIMSYREDAKNGNLSYPLFIIDKVIKNESKKFFEKITVISRNFGVRLVYIKNKGIPKMIKIHSSDESDVM